MYKLGIDIGSTTIKMALVEVSAEHQLVSAAPQIAVVATAYTRHNAEPIWTISPSASPVRLEWDAPNGSEQVFTRK